MKLFIGIEFPTEIKNAIADFVKPFRTTNKGWENPMDFHLTLLFIGETPAEKLNDIQQRLAGIKFQTFKIRLNKLEFFPRRVLYVGIEESLELNKLQKLIEVVYPEWVRPESKAFIPHVTIKRWQRYEYKFLESCISARPFTPLSVQVNDLALFLSGENLIEQKYQVIHRVHAC
jgi:2'-5' RNA ligase